MSDSLPLKKVQEFYDQKYKDAEGDVERQYDIERARAIVVAYCCHWGFNTELSTVGIESSFRLPLIDTKTGQTVTDPAGEPVFYNGIIDWLFYHKNDLFVADHKTKSSAPKESYWTGLRTNPQITQYFLALRQAGHTLKACLWDVIVKPDTKPLKLTKKKHEELATGLYEGELFFGLYTGEEEVETPQMYGHRYRIKMITEPDRYFFRRTIERSASQLMDHMDYLKWIQKSSEAIKCEGHAVKNLYACGDYGTICDYHPICSSDEGDKTGYRVRDTQEGSGPRGGWSNTRCDCFMKCRRKWWYQYKEKLEPLAPSYESNLVLGDYVHQGLEFLKRVSLDPERMVTFG